MAGIRWGKPAAMLAMIAAVASVSEEVCAQAPAEEDTGFDVLQQQLSNAAGQLKRLAASEIVDGGVAKQSGGLGSAQVLLQVTAKTGTSQRQSVPTDFFEDATPTQLAQSSQRASAANDVGEDAVPSYPGSVLSTRLGASAAAVPPVLPRAPPSVVLAQSNVGRTDRHTFFDDEDAAPLGGHSQALGLIGTGSAVATDHMSTQTRQLVEQQGLQLAEEREQMEAEQEAEQQAKQIAISRQQQGQYARLAQVGGDAMSAQTSQKMQVQSSASREMSAEAAVLAARRFFEEQGDLGGKELEKGPARSRPMAAGSDGEGFPSMLQHGAASDLALQSVSTEALEELARSQRAARSRLSGLQLSSESASDSASEQGASSDESKGHRLSGDVHAPGSEPSVGQTGEEGELYGTFVDPNLMRFAFPQKSEGVLRAERQIFQEQDQVARVQQNTTEAFGKLKAAVYHSADESRHREEEAAKLETALRRTELLTDANQHKAQLAHDSRLEAQGIASLERDLQLATEATQGDRELRQTADRQASEEDKARVAALRVAADEEAAEVASAQHSTDRVRDVERGTLRDMTTAALGAGEAASDVVDRYRDFGVVADKQREKSAQRSADLQRYFGVASSVAEGPPLVSSSMPAVSQSLPSTPQQVVGRSVTPITTPVQQPQQSQQQPQQSQQSQESQPSLSLVDASPAADALDASAHVGAAVSCQPGSISWPACASSASTHGPDHSACTPQCTWQCDTPRCDEVCEPECQPPRCETRCSGIDTTGCVMECDEPHCVVACPQTQCPSRDCPTCTATCTEPMCKMRCPNDQPCRNVCEQPSCEWRCRAPEECPEPQCHMVCETPSGCMGSTYRALPPLEPGETSVQSFASQTNLQQFPSSLRGTGSVGAIPSQPPSVLVQLTTDTRQDGEAAANLERSTATLPMISAARQGNMQNLGR